MRPSSGTRTAARAPASLLWRSPRPSCTPGGQWLRGAERSELGTRWQVTDRGCAGTELGKRRQGTCPTQCACFPRARASGSRDCPLRCLHPLSGASTALGCVGPSTRRRSRTPDLACAPRCAFCFPSLGSELPHLGAHPGGLLALVRACAPPGTPGGPYLGGQGWSFP